MSYEELFVYVASLAGRLPGCGFALLVYLIGAAIKEGTNELEMSARDLATNLHFSRDAIRVASRSLTGIVIFQSSHGTSSRWVLPREWFSPQRSLFAASSPVENILRWPGNQATSGRETRPLVDEKPGQVDEKPGHWWTRNQATWPGNQATVDEKPGHSGLETRPPSTQNQQLTDAPSNRIESKCSAHSEAIVSFVDRIMHVDMLENHQQQDAQILRDMLSDYRRRFGQHIQASKPVDDKIIARCLAAAPIETLGETLLKMAAANNEPGDKDAWFVTVFLHLIHDIPRQLTAERVKARYAKKPARRAAEFDFGPALVKQAASGMPTLR